MSRVGRGRFSGDVTVEAARHLRSRERLIWAGHADSGASLGPVIRTTLFGLFFMGFAIVWTFFSWIILSGMDDVGFGLFPFIGGLFILVGLFVVVGGIRKFLLTRSQLYILSNERILIAWGRRREHVWSTDLFAVTGLDMTLNASGNGQLTLQLEGGGKKTLTGVVGVERLADEVDRFRREARGRR